MKKKLLLFAVLLSVTFANAQSFRNGIDNSLAKNTQAASYVSSQEEFIENITVYPNPVIEMLKVSFKSSRKSIALVVLFNNIGKPVCSQESEIDPGINIISIDIRGKSIERGIYFMQFVAENEVFTRKLIVK